MKTSLSDENSQKVSINVWKQFSSENTMFKLAMV